MTSHGIDIKHPKLRGEWAELRFMARASEFGLRVSKPFGDSARYDVTIEHDGQFVRVQVKSTASQKRKSYGCSLHGNRTFYEVTDFDFVAVYLIPLDLWFIIPSAVAIRGQQKLYLSPHYPESIYERYREAWHLLCGKTANRGAASTPAPATSEASACAKKKEDCDQPEDDDSNPDDPPPSLPELRLSAIKWNPVLSHWKPRR